MGIVKNFNNLDTDNTLGGNSPSDYRVSSQKAIKEYVDNHSITVDSAGNCIEITMGSYSGLPAEYQELEYLESTGTQYIDTGIVPTVANETEIRLTFARTEQTTSEAFGTNSNLNVINTTNNWRLNGVQTTIPIVDNEFVNVILKQTSNGRYYKIKTTEGYGSANAQEDNFYLGRLSNAGAAIGGFKGKYKACTTLENGAIVQNLIPCRRKSDSVLGMYDTVTGDFLTNKGTDTFIAGGDVETITKISFINNAGYITLSNLSRYLVEFKKPTTSSPSWYNLYSDGYVEQGGEITVGNTTIGQVTFSKEFENNKYMPILTCITYTAGNIDGLCHITELTTTGMKIFDASGRTYRWECKGYVANS